MPAVATAAALVALLAFTPLAASGATNANPATGVASGLYSLAPDVYARCPANNLSSQFGVGPVHLVLSDSDLAPMSVTLTIGALFGHIYACGRPTATVNSASAPATASFLSGSIETSASVSGGDGHDHAVTGTCGAAVAPFGWNTFVVKRADAGGETPGLTVQCDLRSNSGPILKRSFSDYPASGASVKPAANRTFVISVSDSPANR